MQYLVIKLLYLTSKLTFTFKKKAKIHFETASSFRLLFFES